MPSQERIPRDDEARQSYNFAPGYYGLVYRADVPDYGAGTVHTDHSAKHSSEESPPGTQKSSEEHREGDSQPQYRLQAMKWGKSLGTKPPCGELTSSRSDPVLDQAKPRLRVDDEDHQLPR